MNRRHDETDNVTAASETVPSEGCIHWQGRQGLVFALMWFAKTKVLKAAGLSLLLALVLGKDRQKMAVRFHSHYCFKLIILNGIGNRKH